MGSLRVNKRTGYRAFGSYVVYAGDSITNMGSTGAHANPAGFSTWAQILSNQRLKYDQLSNAGVGGILSTDLLANYPTDVIAKSPKVVVILIGTNDVTGATDSGKATSYAAAIVANIASMIADNRAIGAPTILLKILPRGSVASPMTAYQISCWEQANDGIAGLASSDVFVIDAESAIGNMDAQHTAKVNYLADGLHPAIPGGRGVGEMVANQINAIVDTGSILFTDASDPLNLMPNGFMTGDVSGLATGWTDNGSTPGGATYSFSKLARADGFGEWQRIQISGTYTGNSKYVSLHVTNIDLSSIDAGDLIDFFAEVQVNGAMSGVSAVNLQAVIGGVTAMPYSTEAITNTYDSGDWSGVIRAPSFTATAQGSATSEVTIFIWLEYTATTDAVASDVRIGRIGIRKI